MTPLGGDLDGASYKGYGLAMMVEILSAALAGLTFADPRLGRRPRVGHFLMALNPARFSSAGDFTDHVDALIDAMHGTEPVDPGRPVLVRAIPNRPLSPSAVPTASPLRAASSRTCARWLVSPGCRS